MDAVRLGPGGDNSLEAGFSTASLIGPSGNLYLYQINQGASLLLSQCLW